MQKLFLKSFQLIITVIYLLSYAHLRDANGIRSVSVSVKDYTHLIVA